MGSPVKTDTKMLGSGKMRLCVLFALISMIVTMPRTQEEEIEDVQMLEEEDMRQLLKDLFISSRGARQLDINDEDSEAADLADVTDEASDDDASVMEDSEAKMKAREDEGSRFNNYIDAIYRRINAALRAKMMDPMTLNLDDRQKKKQSPRRSLNKREADGEDDDDDDDYNLDEEDDESEAVLAEDELQSRAGKPERANKNKPRNGAATRRKKNKKSKKGEKEQKGTKKAEREAAKKEKQEKKMKKQELREKKREEKKKKKAKNTRQSRSGDKAKKRNRKQNKNKNEPKMAQKKNKKNDNNNKGRSGPRKNKPRKSSNKNKKSENKNKGRTGSARNNEKSEKMMGSLSGIATLRGEGDVVLEDEENHKVITSEFHVGPLQLEVSKMYGKGQGRTIKSAKAITEVMSGTMTLKVKPDGTAHVRKVVFKEPENVDVKGSLSDNKPRNLRYLKNSVNKMRPLAAIGVLKTARYVLKTPGASSN